jgi:catechol 2,3-dioxygenase-like lactoylglutathione lyase family enzyme
VSARLRAVHPVLASSDVATSVAFYERLGFRQIFRDDARAPRYAAVARDGVELHLQWQEQAGRPETEDRPVYRFLVDDVDSLYGELERAGALTGAERAASPWALPGDTPWGTREFHLRDPDGNGLQFYRPR